MRNRHHADAAAATSAPSTPSPPARRSSPSLGTLAPAPGRLHGVPLGLDARLRPLFSNLSSEDASAVVEQLDADGVPYELSDGGGTVMVPQDKVYATRIALSGEGLPSSAATAATRSSTDRTSPPRKFQEQTELQARHGGRALPAPSRPSTASRPRSSTWPCRRSRSSPTSRTRPPRPCWSPPAPAPRSSAEQVQAIVHLVAASIDGLDPSKVTVADSTGQVLSADDGTGSGGASSPRARRSRTSRAR